jgi:CheY-like chemotaxis protein
MAHALPFVSVEGDRTVAGQCSILYINAAAFADTQTCALRSLGFDVLEVADVPARETLMTYHAVIVRTEPRCRLPTVSARLRSAPLFGRRVLIALVPASVTARDRRDAVDSGFDAVLPEQSSARDLAAAILGMLRKYPEYRCILRSHNGRHKAA